MPQQPSEILRAIANGDREQFESLAEVVYDDLRRLAQNYMGQERRGHSMQASDLVHEAFLKLVDQQQVDWKGRSHFFAIGAQAMRRILVNYAHAKGRVKRGGDLRRVPLEDALTISINQDADILALDGVLEKLAKVDPQQAKIVELRFFGGLTVDETAEAVGLSKRQVEREWTGCRAWLRRELASRIEA